MRKKWTWFEKYPLRNFLREIKKGLFFEAVEANIFLLDNCVQQNIIWDQSGKQPKY